MNKDRFTLIELMIVISIITILAALLLPVLSTVKKKGKRVVCVSNLKQCGTALIMYAGDNSEKMPNHDVGSWALDFYTYGSNVDLRVVKPYIGSFDVWSCPQLDKLPLIDDPANTNSALRGMFGYLPDSGSRYKTVSAKAAKQNSDDQIMFDIVYKYRTSYRSNHSIGGTLKWGAAIGATYTHNPSFGTFFNGIPEGGNTVWADGSAGWRRLIELENVGGQDTWYSGTQ